MSDQRDPGNSDGALAAPCPACGASIAVGATICGSCGALFSGPTGTMVVDSSSTIVTTGGGASSSGAAAGTSAASTTPGGSSGATPGGTALENADRLRARIQQAVGDDFRIIELLGRGGMGIVFRATETALDREVALKVLALDPLLAPEAYERFEREAKLAARLDHPNIVPIFSVGRRESVAFYTMRLVRGGSVEEMLDVRRRFEYDHAVAILKDVAAALDYAHGRGVVHRDIKPGNILIGETGHALVADFGIARALGGTTAGATGTGIIGSPGYMSPEQWRGEQVDGAADQYALAIVAFEMLAGRRPFESPSMQELLQKHLSADVPTVSTYRFGLHEGVDDAIRRALAKSPADRFSTATAFIEALQGLRPTIAANRTGRVPRFEAAPKPRKKRWPKMVALVALAAAGAGVFAAPQTRPQAVRIADAAGVQATDIVAKIRYAIVPPSLDVNVVSADSSAAADDTADTEPLIAGAFDDRIERPEIGIYGDSQPVASSAGVAERQPIAVDPRLGGGNDPFRTVASTDGYVRVVLHGGVAPIIVDGRTIDAAAGPAGEIIRLESGRHYLSVRGAGVLYVPSQLTITISPGDTSLAEFGVPSAMQKPVQGAGAQIGTVQVVRPPAANVPPGAQQAEAQRTGDTARTDASRAAVPADSTKSGAKADSLKPPTPVPPAPRR